MAGTAHRLPHESETDIDDFGWAIGTLLRSYLGRAREAVADLPGGPRGYLMLSLISRGDCQNQAAIADRLGVDRTVVTHLLDELESQQLVARQADPTDRRSRQVVLTPAGEKAFAALSERVAAVEGRLLACFSEAEAEQFRSLLVRAARMADTADETSCDVPHMMTAAH